MAKSIYQELLAEFPIGETEKSMAYVKRLTPEIIAKYGINVANFKVLADNVHRNRFSFKKPEIIQEPKVVNTHHFNFLKDENYNPFQIPEPINDEVEYFDLPNFKKVAFLTDIHLPFYDKLALILAIDYIKKYEPDCIWLNGDILDAYSISRWMKEKNKENLQYEIDCVREFLRTLREIFPHTNIYYKVGNHEDRWEHFLNNNAKALMGVDDFEFENVFRLSKYGIKLVKSKTITKAGKLHIIHGHEVFGSGGVNPSRGLFMKTFNSTICGHYHRTSEYINKSIGNEIMGCFTVGSLSQQRPMYSPVNQYNLGFATIDFSSDGTFSVDNKKIIEGKIY